jgi:hypothetical protein
MGILEKMEEIESKAILAKKRKNSVTDLAFHLPSIPPLDTIFPFVRFTPTSLLFPTSHCRYAVFLNGGEQRRWLGVSQTIRQKAVLLTGDSFR